MCVATLVVVPSAPLDAHSAAFHEASLTMAGFTPGVPPGLEEWASQVDAGVCAEADCEHCGYHSLDYQPWHSGDRYAVLMVCSACGAAAEL